MSPSSRLLSSTAWLLPLASLAPLLPAQIPTGAVVILQGAATPFGFDEYGIADAAGGGSTVLPLQSSPVLFAETNAIGIDPSNANQLSSPRPKASAAATRSSSRSRTPRSRPSCAGTAVRVAAC